MADNQKDLELNIGANIDDFLKDLALMDKEYQEAVRDIEKKKAEIKLQTKVDISGARALGDKMAEIKARNKELNQLIQLQTEKTRLLKKAWEDVAKNQNSSKQQVQAALKAYQNAQVSLNNLQEKANRGGFSSNLSILAPDTFRRIEQVKGVIASIGAEVPMLGKIAPVIAPVAGAFVAAGAAATGFYTILKQIRDGAMDAAKEAMQAGDAVYYLKERLSVNESDATFLQGIFKLDGTDVSGALKALQALDKALLSANEEGTKASQALARYGETLTNGDGSLKNAREQLEAVARAYEKASEQGKGFQLLTETGMGRFSSLIAGWSGYVERSGEVVRAMNDSADAAHKMSDNVNDLQLQSDQIGKVWGNEVVKSMQGALKYQQQLKANQVNYENMHVDELRKGADFAAELDKRFSRLSAIMDRVNSNTKIMFAKWSDSSIGKALMAFGDKLSNWAGAKLGIEFDDKTSVADFKKAQDAVQKTAQENPIIQEVSIAVKKANDKLDKALRDAKATDYERELNRIQDEVDAYTAAGADKLKAEELFQIKKAELDKKYDDKRNSEIERANKEAQARIQAAENASRQIQQIFMTETQRRIAEIEKQRDAWIKAGADEVEASRAAEKLKSDARISEAERTLREQVMLVRKMQQEEAKGGNWQQRVMDWQDNQYMKKNGFKTSDITALQRYGTDLVNQLANSRDRIFAGFAGGNNVTNNNNTTVNIDRPVLTDESLINQLVDRVADKLVPVAEKAFGQSANAY